MAVHITRCWNGTRRSGAETSGNTDMKGRTSDNTRTAYGQKNKEEEERERGKKKRRDVVSTCVGRVYTYIHSLSWATVEDDDDEAMCQLANRTNPYEIWEVSINCVYPRYAEESQCLSQTIDANFFIQLHLTAAEIGRP